MLYWKDEAEASAAQAKSLAAGTASQRQVGDLEKRLAEAESARDSAAANSQQAVQVRTPPPRRRAAAHRAAVPRAATRRHSPRRRRSPRIAAPRAAPPLVVHRAHGAAPPRSQGCAP